MIPTFNRPKLLDRLLSSIAKQTFKDYEVIIVDDHSDSLYEYNLILKKYRLIIKELRFFRNGSNKGAPYSRNKGILNSKYNFIALVDDDDEWLKEKLEKQTKLLDLSDKHTGLIYTWTSVVDKYGKVINKYKPEIEGNCKKEILEECFIPSPSVLVRKNVIIESGLFDIRFPSCQDWDMWTRIILKNYKVKVIKEYLTVYHKHENHSIGMSKNAIRGYRLFFNKYIKFFYYNWKLIPRFLKYNLIKYD